MNKSLQPEIDQHTTFQLDPSRGYVELMFNASQAKPITGWTVQPHMEPCRVSYITIIILCLFIIDQRA